MSDEKEVVIEVEEFISLVRARRCLWDVADCKYSKRDYQRVAWLEVADVTHAPVSELKKRWRGLRDTFARELRRLEAGGARADSELAAAAGWRHFEQLLFLRRVVLIARSNKNKQRGHSSGRERSSSRESDPLTARRLVKCEQQPDSEPESPSPEPAAAAPGRCAGSRSRSRSRSAGSDGDSQFLLSLAPFLRSVPRRRKLLVRARLTQVLIDEQNQTNILTLQPQL